MTNGLELVKVKCETCDGKRICVECDGRKIINIGVHGEVEVSCSLCHGSGKCKKCNGTGDVWVRDNKPLW